MKFVYPHWLWGLVLLPLWIGLQWFYQRYRRTFLEKTISPSLWKVVIPNLNFKSSQMKGVFWILGYVCVVLALARPQWGAKEEVLPSHGLDLVVALDVSNSMAVEDVAPNRLKKAKRFIRQLAERLGGDRMGLVIFAGSAYLASPLTTDLDYFLETLEVVDPTFIANQGTHLGAALDVALKSLERGALDPGLEPEIAKDLPASRVIVLLTDGENQEELTKEVVENIKKKAVELYVFGVGTEQGGPVPVRDDRGVLKGYRRFSNEPVVSQLNSKSLQKLSQDAGGRYWNLGGEQKELEDLLRDLGTLERAKGQERKFLVYEEKFQIPLGMAIVCFLIELTLARAYQRGRFLLTLLLFATSAQGSEPELEVYRKNQEGVKAFKQGQFETARKYFGAAQALAPDSSELLFNKGLVQKEQKNWEGARHGFEASKQEALRNGNYPLAAKSLYNLGSVYADQKNLGKAIQSYSDAIEMAQKSHDSDLEQAARNKIQILHQQQQQKSNSKDSKDSKDQQAGSDQKDSQGNQKDSASKDGSQGDTENNSEGSQDPKDSQAKEKGDKQSRPLVHPKRDFQSPQFSQEDVERVMVELADREKDLQKRLRKQESQQNPSNGRDW